MQQSSTRNGPGNRLLPLIGFALVIGLVSSASAEQPPTDPVKALRNVLREELTYPSPFAATDAERKRREKLRDDLLAYRSKKLVKAAGNVHSLGALGRAILLGEWNLTSTDDKVVKVDKDVLDSIANRFKGEFRGALSKGETAHQLAALQLVGEMAVQNQNSNKGKSGYAELVLDDLQDDVIAVVKNNAKDASIREEGIVALGKMNPDATKLGKALEPFILSPTSSPALMEATLKALGNSIKNAQTKAQGRNAVARDRTNLVKTDEIALPLLLKGLNERFPVEVRKAAVKGLDLLTASTDAFRPLLGRKYPPEGRPRTKDEQQTIEADYRAIEDEEKTLEPLITSLEKDIGFLAKAGHDSDSKIQIAAREVLEDFSVILYRLDGQRNDIPSLKNDGKKDDNKEASTRKKLRSALLSALPSVIEGLSNAGEPRAKIHSLQTIEWLGRNAEHAASAVTGTLRDDDTFVKWVSARALSTISNPAKPVPGAIAGLTNLLGDSDPDVRRAAAKALTSFEPTPAVISQAVPALSQEIGNPDRDVKIKLEYLDTIASFRGAGKDAVSGLIQALKDESEEVRIRAAEVLAGLGPLAAEAIPALKEAQKDRKMAVRRAVNEALLSVSRPGS